VTEVRQPVDCEAQFRAMAQIGQRQIACRQLLSEAGKLLKNRRIVELDYVAMFVICEQQSGFFETFANCGNPKSEPAAIQLKRTARVRVVDAAAMGDDAPI
jgi:hypothetical protein